LSAEPSETGENEMTNFDLQKPSYVPDDLDEATTNDGSSIEIEIVDERDGQPDEAQEWHDFDPDC
tara:strand:- start:28 stop:222 length:195 start_codon:yes stop_codon:yes gene_type:complete